jgi:flagellar biosynthesis protein FliR
MSIEWLKSVFTQAITLEKKTSPGKMNQKWATWTFLAWLASAVIGFSLKYTPVNGNPLKNGFTLQIDNVDFTAMTVIMLLSLPACVVLLYSAQKMGWLKKID